MVRQSVDFLRLKAVLLGAGIFVSSTLGQTARINTSPVVETKSSVADSAGSKVPPAGSKTVESTEMAPINGPKSTGADSSVQNTSTATAISVPDSSAAKDAAMTSTSDSSAVVTDTATSVQAAAVPGVDTAADSSKLESVPAPAAQAEVAASDTSTVKNEAPAVDGKKSEARKEYDNIGVGLVLLGGSWGPQVGVVGSVHQFLHCSMPINVRALFAYMPFRKNMDQTVSDQKLGININSKVSSADLLLDFHLFKNWFRLSTGAVFSFSTTKVKMESKEGKSIGMITVTPEEMGNIEFTFSRRPVAPYLGVGVGNTIGRRVTFLTDLGVAYTGPLKVKGTGTGMIGPSSENAQNLQKVFDKHYELFWWPVVSLGIGVNLF